MHRSKQHSYSIPSAVQDRWFAQRERPPRGGFSENRSGFDQTAGQRPLLCFAISKEAEADKVGDQHRLSQGKREAARCHREYAVRDVLVPQARPHRTSA
jgi:hypothetical protein